MSYRNCQNWQKIQNFVINSKSLDKDEIEKAVNNFRMGGLTINKLLFLLNFLQAAVKLIQKMDLCQPEFESDEENESLVINKKLASEDTYNPTIQYFNQVINHKVVNFR